MTALDVFLHEGRAGQLQNPRARFRFQTLGAELLMIAWLRPFKRGVHTCVGTIEPSRKVRLPFELGDYRLYDGSTFPPLRAGKARERYP